MKNVVFLIANQITQTQPTQSLVLGTDRHLPFSIEKVCAEILNFAIAV